MSRPDPEAERRSLRARLAEAAEPPAAGLAARLRRQPEPAASEAQLAILDELAKRALKRQSDLQAGLARVEAEADVLGKRLRRVESGLKALLRLELEALSGRPADPLDLDARRFSLLSQNEEDGYVLALLGHCGAPNRSFVELGSGRTGGNSGLLAQTAGWRGLMVDANPEATPVAAARFGLTGRVKVVTDFVTPDNVDRLIEEAGLAGEVDLFSLDIDSFDYWVLKAMTACSPRLMILEYNDRFGPEARVTVPLGSQELSRRRHYFGVSLAALTALAGERGYRLVACDSAGTNGFFVRQDLAPALPTRRPEEVWRENPRRRGEPSGADFIAGLAADGLALVEV
ncbi:hypothetical protein SAMN06265365_107176 [Tistlia consotensis]|uniref:Methyltransferase domain-containing protein n=1 Tax=Tistlia consotensis USBA 355 TaxID=560819 RepID=A0A1Y6BAZ5_9PROT|nr:hypothetical protein [Tistlia consotensis]SME98508.1 hypothetical protein SAMN05428998_102178 [Tistlia consotensis USBA 355]SNR57885.1 hypothetical protein SAMN06265365_107176 [Tistlia consotensis]